MPLPPPPKKVSSAWDIVFTWQKSAIEKFGRRKEQNGGTGFGSWLRKDPGVGSLGGEGTDMKKRGLSPCFMSPAILCCSQLSPLLLWPVTLSSVPGSALMEQQVLNCTHTLRSGFSIPRMLQGWPPCLSHSSSALDSCPQSCTLLGFPPPGSPLRIIGTDPVCHQGHSGPEGSRSTQGTSPWLWAWTAS